MPLPPLNGSFRSWFRAFATQCSGEVVGQLLPRLQRSNAVTTPPPFSWARFLVSHKDLITPDAKDAPDLAVDARLGGPLPGWYYVDSAGVFFSHTDAWKLVAQVDLPVPPPGPLFFRIVRSEF